MNFGSGVLIAVLLLALPGAVVGWAGGLRWAPAMALGPVLTYGVVGLAIVPFGALGIRWDALSALVVLAAVALALLGGRVLLAGRHGARPAPRSRPYADWRAGSTCCTSPPTARRMCSSSASGR